MPPPEHKEQKHWYPAVREVALFVAVVWAVIAVFSLATAPSGDRDRLGSASPEAATPQPVAETAAPRPAAAGRLRAGTVACETYFDVQEYWQSVRNRDERQQQYLFTDRCGVLRSVEYSIIDDSGVYPQIRLYLEDGRSVRVWLTAPLP